MEIILIAGDGNERLTFITIKMTILLRHTCDFIFAIQGSAMSAYGYELMHIRM